MSLKSPLACVGVAFAAGALGFLAWGPWAVAGAAAGALAGFAIAFRGLGLRPAIAAAALPPLVASGPAALAVAAVHALVLARGRWPGPWWFFAAAPAVLLPWPAGALIPAGAGALAVALAPRALALAGLGLALLPWVASPSALPLPGLLACAGAALARWTASHPANLTAARRLAAAGLAMLPAPALALLAIVSMSRVTENVMVLYGLVAAALAVGGLAFLGHLGSALWIRAGDGEAALGATLTWAFLGMTVGLAMSEGARVAGGSALALAGLLAIPSAVAVAWLSRVFGPVVRLPERPPSAKENLKAR